MTEQHVDHELTIGALSERTGVATSALRFYEAEHLISSTRSPGGQRRYTRDTIRRVSFIRIAQQVGLSLDEIRTALLSLPAGRTPTAMVTCASEVPRGGCLCGCDGMARPFARRSMRRCCLMQSTLLASRVEQRQSSG